VRQGWSSSQKFKSILLQLKMSDYILEDDRVKWLRQKVVLALEITPEAFDDHFKDSTEKGGAAANARQQISDYLSEKSGAGSALFFSAHNWAEDIEGRI